MKRGKTDFLAGLMVTWGVAFSSASAQVIQYTYGTIPAHAPHFDSFYNYSYDRNGDLTQITDRYTNAVKQRLEYNSLNKLLRATVGSAVTEYRYDANGNRIEKIAPAGTEKYYGLIEAKGSTKTYYYFLGNRRVAQRTIGGTLYFHQQDHLGSASVLTDQSGVVQSRTSYHEFGSIKYQEGQGGLSDYTYNDKRWDKETNFYDYGARAYNAKMFKFTTPDSIVPNPTNPQSLNRYAYVRNNPLKYIDPSGHADDLSQLLQISHNPLPTEVAEKGTDLLDMMNAYEMGERIANITSWVSGFPGKIARHEFEKDDPLGVKHAMGPYIEGGVNFAVGAALGGAFMRSPGAAAAANVDEGLQEALVTRETLQQLIREYDAAEPEFQGLRVAEFDSALRNYGRAVINPRGSLRDPIVTTNSEGQGFRGGLHRIMGDGLEASPQLFDKKTFTFRSLSPDVAEFAKEFRLQTYEYKPSDLMPPVLRQNYEQWNAVDKIDKMIEKMMLRNDGETIH